MRDVERGAPATVTSWYSADLTKRIKTVLWERTRQLDIPGTSVKLNPQGDLQRDEGFLRVSGVLVLMCGWTNDML